jgi:hypothetical protein
MPLSGYPHYLLLPIKFSSGPENSDCAAPPSVYIGNALVITNAHDEEITTALKSTHAECTFCSSGCSRKEFAMHDILVALVFVSLVASPAIVAAMPLRQDEDDSNGVPERAKAPLLSPSNIR